MTIIRDPKQQIRALARRKTAQAAGAAEPDDGIERTYRDCPLEGVRKKLAELNQRMTPLPPAPSIPPGPASAQTAPSPTPPATDDDAEECTGR
ncbi:MAG: hypothetical protein HYS13_09855 [Planctomycetia bacterium]|nr:hypothetical protein [Planctomycetia bacterium]